MIRPREYPSTETSTLPQISLPDGYRKYAFRSTTSPIAKMIRKYWLWYCFGVVVIKDIDDQDDRVIRRDHADDCS